MRSRPFLASILAVLAIAGGAASPARAQFPPSITAEVHLPPTPIPAMGHTYLTYELQVASYLPVDVDLVRVDAFLDDEAKPVLTLEGESLTSALLKPGGAAVPAGKLRAGAFDVVYMLIELPGGAAPKSLRHVVSIALGGQQAAVEARVSVGATRHLPVLGAPLRGGPWVMAHGLNNTSGHRQIILPLEGRPTVPQRYAIDYHKIDRDGQIFSGKRERREDHYAYGQEVLAVADAVVADTKDGIPENEVSDTKRAVPITLETVGGNYVILDLGNGTYGFYAHLQPGSLRVKKGDRVRKGQVIGLLGLSGNTPAPHLHFNLGDRPAGLANESLPYVFERFEVLGECPGGTQQWTWYQACSFSAPDKRERELPLAWKIVQFPD